MQQRDDYPAGVPCWIDLVQADVEATKAFYSGLFGWTFDLRTPPEAPASYAYALVDGGTVGGIGNPPMDADPPGWTTYISVASADEAAAAVEANGGKVLGPPTDIGPSGRVAQCADPEGARFGVWQPAGLRGAQVVNAPGSWNFSELNTADPEGAVRFYGSVFGWELAPFDMGGGQTNGFFWVRGYGDFLAERDPDLRERQDAEQAPGGFADAVAILQQLAVDGADQTPHWSTTFAVGDADAAFARATELGAEVVTAPFDTDYTRQSAVRDPQGAVLTLSEYGLPALPDHSGGRGSASSTIRSGAGGARRHPRSPAATRIGSPRQPVGSTRRHGPPGSTEPRGVRKCRSPPSACHITAVLGVIHPWGSPPWSIRAVPCLHRTRSIITRRRPIPLGLPN